MDIDRDVLARDNRQISILMEMRANQALSEHELTAVQAHMLLYILHHSEDGTSLTAIHQELGVSKAALSSLVKRLRDKGYVQVERCAGDDRRKLLFGTEKGRDVWASLEHSMGAVQEQMYCCLSPQELAELDRMQKKMLRNLSVSNEETNKEVSQL